MKSRGKVMCGILLLIGVIFLLVGCTIKETVRDTSFPAGGEYEFTPTEDTFTPLPVSEPIILDASVIENRPNELVFNISMDDFIESYNSLYLQDKGSTYLGVKSEWRKFTYEDAIHSDYETSIFEFSIDERVWSQPTIKVYVPTNADYIQEITVNFDEHGYSESFYREFEELCFYTLKVFFPELDNERVIALYEEANYLGNANVFLNEDGYEKGCTPYALFHKDGIGVYPYFAIGEWVHLCIVPVTDEMLADYAAKGVEIYEIE